MWILIYLKVLTACLVCSEIEVIPYHEHNLTVLGIFPREALVSMEAFKTGLELVSPGDGKITFNPIVVNPAALDSFSIWKAACSVQRSLPVAVFGPQIPYSDIAVEDACRIAGIPYFRATWRPPNPELDVLTPPEFPTPNLFPDSDDIASAMAAVLDLFHWKTFTILYEDNLGLIRVQQLLAAKDSNDGAITIRQLTPGGDNKPIFKELRELHESKILLDCHVERIEEYLSAAGEVGMLNEYQGYIIANLETHTVDITKVPNLNANVTWLNMIPPDELRLLDSPLQTYVDKWNENILKNGIEKPIHITQAKLEYILAQDFANHLKVAISESQATEPIEFKPPLLCHAEAPWDAGAKLMESILLTNSTGYSGTIQFDKWGRRINYNLNVEEMINGLPPVIVAKWNSTTKSLEEVQLTNSDVQQTSKKKSKHFRVISRIAEPYLKFKQPEEGEVLEGNDRFEGYSLDLITEIFNFLNLEGLNYTFSFLTLEDNSTSYGRFDNETGQWNGLIGLILAKDADLAVCDLTITEERRKVVDFSVSFMTLGISILFKEEEKENPGTFSFLNPFSVEVWLYTATSYLVVSISLFIAARISPADWENPQPCEEPEELENIWNFKNCTWLTIGSVMTQGCDILPKAPGSRWIVGMWWFFTLIVVQTYIAQLAASLTNTRYVTPINSVEDLADQRKIQYGVLEGGSTAKFFETSPNPMYQRMWNVMKTSRPSVFTKSSEEGARRVIKGRNQYAFFMESVTIEYMMRRECNLIQVGGLLDSKDFGIAMPPNSPFRSDINRAILRMQESQILPKIKKKWWSEKFNAVECPVAPRDESDADLEIENLIGAFLVLGVGCALAVVISCAEFYHHCRNIMVSEQVPMKQVFFEELKSSLNLKKDQKPVLKKGSQSPGEDRSSSTRRSRSRSRAASFIRDVAASFINLEKNYE